MGGLARAQPGADPAARSRRSDRPDRIATSRPTTRVLAALRGMLYVNGLPDAAPVRPLGLAGVSFGGLLRRDRDDVRAVRARLATGAGQWIDLSMQEATAAAVEHVAGSYFGTGEIEPRRGTLHWSRYFRVGRCRDGYVMHCTLGDWTSLIEWVDGDGKAQDLTDPEWEDVPYRRGARRASVRRARRMGQGLRARRVARARADSAPALRHRCATPKRCSTTSNCGARLFRRVEHPELGRTFRYPGAPYLFTGSPWRVRGGRRWSANIPAKSCATSSGSARRNSRRWPPRE